MPTKSGRPKDGRQPEAPANRQTTGVRKRRTAETKPARPGRILVEPPVPVVNPAATILPGDGVYRPHRFALLFPLMEGEAFVELTENIRQHGVREPIVLLDGEVLDGRNRYLAAREAGQPIPTREYEGDDPLGFVISLNLHRRHLDDGQRGMVAARIARLRTGDNQHSEGPSIEEASRMLNVGHATTERARFVQDAGTPALVAEAEAGRVSVSAAAEVATLPEAQQFELIARGEKEIVAKAKELRAAKVEANRAIRNAIRQDAAKRRRARPTPEEQKKQLAREKRHEKRRAADEKHLEEDRLCRERVRDELIEMLRAELSAETMQWLAKAASDLPRYETLQDFARRVGTA